LVDTEVATVENTEKETRMTLLDHLDELRTRIIYSLVAITTGFIVAFIFSADIINLLKAVAPANTQFVQLSPGEVFIVSMKMALYAGIYIASPVIYYHIIKFISPGLKLPEKKFILPIVIATFILFTIGMLFGYFAALPLALNFLLGYGSEVAQNVISIEKYTSFCSATILIMGVLFQVPLLLLFLSIINIVSSAKLIEIWKYVILIAFIVGAVITPSPDPFGQTIVAGAILILYGISIVLIKLIKR
jgi:sec-independent protein translocase protein TatC